MFNRSRKKLEKSLKDAKEELGSLTERLQVTHTELKMRDDKIQSLLRQIEVKNVELASSKVNFP